MVKIDIDERNGPSYKTGSDIITVKTETYNGCDLFEKVTHTPSGSHVYLDFKRSSKNSFREKYIFYESGIKSVDVYFSKYNPKTPLVLVITTSVSRHYPFSYLNNIGTNTPILTGKFNEPNLLDHLISENDKLNGVITYRLEKTGNDKSYINISVARTYGPSKLLETYTHSGKEVQGQTSLLLFNNNQIKLEKNYEFKGKKLDDVRNKSYCSIKTYFDKQSSSSNHLPQTNNGIGTIDENLPIFLELTEYKSPLDICDETSYFLRRADIKGIHWKQIKKPDLNSSDDVERINQEIKYDNKESIMVQISEKSSYEMKIIKNYETDGIGQQTTPFKQIKVTGQDLSRSTYKYFKHDLSSSKELKDLSIESIKLYIGNIELKVNDSRNEKQKLYYKQGEDHKIFVYFFSRYNFPLMITYNDRYYGSIKVNYLSTWTEIQELRTYDPTDNDTAVRIRNKLDSLNKEFNEIDLSKTSGDGYGIKKKQEREEEGSNSYHTNGNFNGKRVKVSRQSPNGLYGKVIHSTFNGFSIGKVKFGEKELENDQKKNLSETQELKSTTYSHVIAYYHRRDSNHLKPLLIGFGRDSVNANVFYERFDRHYPLIKWRKADSSELRTFQTDGSALTKKINDIYYNIGKSVEIEIESQEGHGYDLKVVENTCQDVPKTIGDGSKISISKDDRCSTGSNYTCYKHTITASNKAFTDGTITGVRFYISTHEIVIHKSDGTKLAVYYESDKNVVNVYFYNGDHVPLLVAYDSKYYIPSTRDEYFRKWLIDTSITSRDNVNLKSKLDTINKELNKIEIENTKANYGLKMLENNNGVENFSTDRISVTQDQSTDNYRKVIHTTVNSGPIGDIYFDGKKIESIDTNINGAFYNKVSVYYEVGDPTYNNPLLLELRPVPTSGSMKFYSKRGLGPTEWNEDSGQYESDESIKARLNTIKSSLSNSIHIDLARQTSYDAYVSKGSDEGSKEQVGRINVGAYHGTSNYKADDHRYYEHNLPQYYTDNKSSIISKLELGNVSDLTLLLKIKISNRDIQLVKDSQSLSTPLTYGSSEYLKEENLLVYFYEGKGYGDDEDTVPLLFKYGNQFFGPQSNEKYFDTWKDLGINMGGSGVMKNNIKTKLDDINSMLNEIDLSETNGNYGLPLNPKPGDFDVTRITVTPLETFGSKLQRVRHTTKNTFRIGKIKGVKSGCNFDNEHNNKITRSIINQVIVYYCTKELDRPKLVLICESASGGTSYVHGYYDLTKGGERGEYEFKPLGGLNLEDLEGEDQENSYVDQTLSEIFRQLCTQPQNREPMLFKRVHHQ